MNFPNLALAKQPYAPAVITSGELWLPSRGSLHRVELKDIKRIEAEADYVRIFTIERSFLYRTTLNRLETQIGPETLVRIHRSTMIAKREIAALRHVRNGAWCVVTWDGSESAIGRKYFNGLKLELGISGPNGA